MIEERGQTRSYTCEGDPSRELEALMAKCKPASRTPGSVFNGGAVGYFAYDMVRFFEPTLSPPPPDSLGLPDMVFFITDTVLIFDHKHRKLSVVANVFLDEHSDLEAAYAWAEQQIEAVIDKLSKPLAVKPLQAFRRMRAWSYHRCVATRRRPEIPRRWSSPDTSRRATSPSSCRRAALRGRLHRRADRSVSRAASCESVALHVHPRAAAKLRVGRFIARGPCEEHRRQNRDPSIAGTRWRGKTKEEDEALATELFG